MYEMGGDGMYDSDGAGELERLRRRVALLERQAADPHGAAALDLSERRFRSVIENMRGIVFYRGDGGREVRLYGADVQEMVGTLQADGRADTDAWRAAIHPDDRDRYLVLARRRRELGEGYTVEFRYTHPRTGRLIWARERGWVVAMPDGAWFHDGYILDITAEKDQERRLCEAIAAVQLANRTKGEFLSNMSHELRTPLNAIIGFTELLLGQTFGPLGSPRYRDYCGDILTSAHHLAQMVEDLLDIARTEPAGIEFREAMADAGSILHDAVRMMRERAHGKGLAVTAELAPHLPQLRCDARRVRQILVNLLSNAVKFTPAGGHITVSAAERADGGVTFAVADTGIGMAAEDIPRALEPFVQIDSGLGRHYEGAGLGLPLSRRLAELHDARLEIESAPGRGTRVTLDLPAARSLRPGAGMPP